MKILLYSDRKIYPVVKMTPEERIKYYSPLINYYHSIDVWTDKHEARYKLLKEQRVNDAYLFSKMGIIVFSELEKNIKWEFIPEQKLLFT